MSEVNLNDRQISDDERFILSKGLSFAISPIAGTEAVTKQMTDTNADGLRCEVVRTIKRAKHQQKERTALNELNKDKYVIMLPADKGRAIVLVNITEYREKLTAMAGDTNTYTKLGKHPTHKYKLINILKKGDKSGSITDTLYWTLYPDSAEPPKLYGTPLRSTTSQCQKHLGAGGQTKGVGNTTWTKTGVIRRHSTLVPVDKAL